MHKLVKGPHLNHMTQLTRKGVRDMKNYKPFRTRAQKAKAREMAVLGKDGVYRSTAPVSYH